MQKVCKEGKPAQTIYDVIEIADGRTRVHFYPVTVSWSVDKIVFHHRTVVSALHL